VELDIQVRQAKGRTTVVLAGVIDETSAEALSAAFLRVEAILEINFRGISRINSYGIGLLMKHFGQLSRSHRIEFVECSATIVDQFQMLDFSMYGRIGSFFIRYYCARCGAEEDRLLQVGEDISAEKAPPDFVCDCGGRLEVDEALDFLAEHL
jgi:anti-anti-sigma regulatory factor